MRLTLIFMVLMASMPLSATAELGVRRAALVDGMALPTWPTGATAALLATASDGITREGAFMCSAVLVSPTEALTAAHCVALVEADAAEEGWQLDWWVSFAPDVRGFDGSEPVLPSDTVGVEEVVAHPGFAEAGPLRSDRPDRAHDIAVLRLAEPAPAAPVPIARPSAALDAALDAAPVAVWVAGYGFEVAGSEATRGRRLGGPSRLFAVGTHELRVGRQTEPGAGAEGLAEKCGGDSGGPTFLQTPEGWRLIGLTSRAWAGDGVCAVAGLDTRVDAYADWIDAVAESVAVDGRAGGCGVGTDGDGWPLGVLLVLGWARRARSREVC